MQNSMQIFDLSKLIVLKTTVFGPLHLRSRTKAMPSKYNGLSPQKTYSKNHMIRTVVWCGSRLRPYPQATRGTFSEARSQSLATLPRRWVGSEGSEIIAHATQKERRVTTNLWQYQQNFSEASKNIAPATQKKEVGSQATPGSRARELLGGIEHIAPATQKERVVTKYFSEDGLLVHLPHKMEIGSRETSQHLTLPNKHV